MYRQTSSAFRFAVVAAAILLTGCSVMRSQEAAQAKKEMIGMPKSRILACMGVPAARAAESGVEVWSYNSGGDSNSVGTGTATASGGWAYGVGTSKTYQRYCVVNVVFQGDRVSSVNYSGRTGGVLTGGEQCAFAVENCIQ